MLCFDHKETTCNQHGSHKDENGPLYSQRQSSQTQVFHYMISVHQLVLVCKNLQKKAVQNGEELDERETEGSAETIEIASMAGHA